LLFLQQFVLRFTLKRFFMMSNSEGNILSFIAGIAIGALVGILVAPDKGQATRGKIAQKSNQFRRELEEQVEVSKEKIERFADNVIRKKEQEQQEKAAEA
jgi:gas vesicle protein